MKFNWINGLNTVIIVYLLVVNIIAFKIKRTSDLRSRYSLLNFGEQLGRIASILLMIFPIFVRNIEFQLNSKLMGIIYVFVNFLLLFVYTYLWLIVTKNKMSIFYGLGIIPGLIFLIDGMLLKNWVLVVATIVFTSAHLAIIREKTARI